MKNSQGAPAPLWVLCMMAGVALAFRPAAPAGSLAVAVAVGLLGLLAPVPPSVGHGGGRLRWLAATALGIAAAVTARGMQHSLPPPPPAWFAILAVIAAIAEEVFFRRLLYGWLAIYGPVVAVVGAAAVFAAIHVPAYGISALPVDFAAGLVFGWQRWATGTWSSAAVTHATANLLQMR